jgi:hypothetical protein
VRSPGPARSTSASSRPCRLHACRLRRDPRPQQGLCGGRRPLDPRRRQPRERDRRVARGAGRGHRGARKTRFGAFSTTDLYATLHGQGIDTLVVAGLSTSGVVLSTLRDAADEDYRLFVLADATADPDPEVHRVLVEKVFPHQADVIETEELAALSGR